MLGNEDLEESAACFIVKYSRSFMVVGDVPEERLNCVRIHLEAMSRNAHSSKPILLEIASCGIRILSIDGQTVHMVHSLKRISYATCDPNWCQFAFSARQPSFVQDLGSKAPPAHPLPGVQYCHVFITDSPEQAKEINDCVCRIFREAERGGRCRHEFCYEFSKTLTDSNRDEKRDTFNSSGSSNSATSSTFSGHTNETNGPRIETLEGKRCEKQSEDLRGISDDQGHHSGSHPVEEARSTHSPIIDPAYEIPANPTVASPVVGKLPASVPSSRSQSNFSGPAEMDNSRPVHTTHVMDSQAARCTDSSDDPSQSLATGDGELNASRFITIDVKEDNAKSPLRPKSKRQKRRPLSAVLTNFGPGKRMEPVTGLPNMETLDDSVRGTSMENVPESNKNGSIFKRLFHLKLGNGSSLRLNVSTVSSETNGLDVSGRQSSSHSVRFLGHGLDQAKSSTCSTGQLLPGASKRRRRPLSAVFGSPSVQTVQDGPGRCLVPLPNGADRTYVNIPALTPAGTPAGTKKLGSARSAVNKMFGFSSSRRKSRSSVQLDVIRSYPHITYSPMACSLNGEHQSVANVIRQVCPPANGNTPRKDARTAHCVDGASPASGVGCGEHCSVSMPNLQCSAEQPLPLTCEDEAKLSGAAWFCGPVSRQLAAQVLENEPEGAFVVRRSVNQSMSLVLSVRVPHGHNPSGVSHYLILHTARGFKLKGFTKDFPSVHALVTHHSFMAEQLPCRLLFTDREVRFNRSLFTASSNSVPSDQHPAPSHHYQKRCPQSRHSSPFVNKRHDLGPVTEEDTIYGKLPSQSPLC